MPHKCDVCHKAYRRKSNLTMHQYVHTGERPYVCDICTKAFVSSYVLRTHRHMHTGDE